MLSPLYGWASGNTLITLTGLIWQEDVSLELFLVFNFSMVSPTYAQQMPMPCKRIGLRVAQCLSPPALVQSAESTASLFLEVRVAGDLHVFRLRDRFFNYVPVPGITKVVPDTASIEGGTWLEVCRLSIEPFLTSAGAVTDLYENIW